MKTMTVKVVGKEISGKSGKFTTYAVLSASGNWYRTAKVEPSELKPYQGEVAVITISRKFDKTFTNSKGIEGSMPTLVIEEIRLPNEEEKKAFDTAIDKLNSETLKGVN